MPRALPPRTGARCRTPSCSGGPAAHLPDQTARLGALSPQLAMALHLSADVLRERLDRVAHLRRALLGVKRGPLQPQGRLGHELVGDGGVGLLPQHDFETGVFRHLAFDPLESLAYPLTNLTVNVEATTDNLDLHDVSSL